MHRETPTQQLSANLNQQFSKQYKIMNKSWTDRWNERYSQDEFAYGQSPNSYLKKQIEKLLVGKILFAAEGEGRNAVFAAKGGRINSEIEKSCTKILDLLNQRMLSITTQNLGTKK